MSELCSSLEEAPNQQTSFEMSSSTDALVQRLEAEGGITSISPKTVFELNRDTDRAYTEAHNQLVKRENNLPEHKGNIIFTRPPTY